MNIKTIGQLLDYVETKEKANELINYINKQQKIIDKIKEYIKERKKYKGDPFYLDEIQKLLMPIIEYKQEVDTLTINYKNIDTVIYEMPKE